VKIEGDPEAPHNMGKQCAKGQAAIMTLYDPNRVKTPLIRTNPEKGIGVDPKWKAISWKEALNIVCERIRKVREDNPDKLNLSTWDTVFDNHIKRPWLRAFGIKGAGGGLEWSRHANYMCGAGLHSSTYLINGTFHNEVDLDHCNYFILFGAGHGFLSGHAPLLAARKMAEARARGLKVVVVDPRCSNAAAKADEWIPIRPSTDGAMALGMLHVLLNEQEVYDREFIKKRTNGCYLVAPDGKYARDEKTKKPLVWDSVESKAKTFDAKVKDYAIEGSYQVNGVECHPAFQLLKERVKKYTPEEVAPITTVPAATIRRIAQEFGEAARIGSNIIIEGTELPYRPVACIFYKGIVISEQATWQGLSIFLLPIVVGSYYSPGGYGGTSPFNPPGEWPRSKWSLGENSDGLLLPQTVAREAWDQYDVKEGAPIGHYHPEDEDKYRATPKEGTEVSIHIRTNPALSKYSPAQIKTLRETPFQVSICDTLNETAEFADVVLPDQRILERFNPFPNSKLLSHISQLSGYYYCGVGHQVVKPAYEARHWCEVLLEIADRVGFLKDFYGYFNDAMIVDPAYKLDVEKKYSLEEIYDNWTKSEFGPDRGLDWFKEHGYLRMKRTAEERYPINQIKARVPIYYEHYIQAGEDIRTLMKERGLTEFDTSAFVALVQWIPGPAYKRRESTEYDLLSVNYSDPIFFKTTSPENVWLNEIAERHPRTLKIEINTETAKKRGIKDGDTIWVESIAGKVKGIAKVTECIHPEVVSVAGSLGGWAKGRPIARGKGVHYNSLLPEAEDRVDHITGGIEGCVEVKVYKAED